MEKIIIDKTMRADMLKAPLVINKFVNGEPKCNYEIYMLELVNKSLWFRMKYPEGFEKPDSENNGECDAINVNYQLDFKLFVAPTALRAKKLCEPQVSVVKCGVTTYGRSKVQNSSFKATRLFVAFRGKSLEELYQLRANTKKSIVLIMIFHLC